MAPGRPRGAQQRHTPQNTLNTHLSQACALAGFHSTYFSYNVRHLYVVVEQRKQSNTHARRLAHIYKCVQSSALAPSPTQTLLAELQTQKPWVGGYDQIPLSHLRCCHASPHCQHTHTPTQTHTHTLLTHTHTPTPVNVAQAELQLDVLLEQFVLGASA